ncbi:putative fructose-2,6-bisphosphatase TIGAR [Apostichopus japonicus]|uniref:Fructose-2,6-bisphosphatase TIGAR n=1 Tax=Stichopus japonicus TaxID=307972 RepID=A0A2G8LIQ3_STIJA|nr:putative fructose-2,6-bisphosphatase TIGAR [Apostichopus japonicus]
MSKIRFTLVRHGESAFNSMNLVQGHMNPGLSTLGCHQAELIGKRLQNEKYDFVYTSDLKRACHTAEIILRRNQETKIQPTQDARLREVNLGIWQGWPISVLRGTLAQLKIPMAEFEFEDGESRDQLLTRAVSFIDDLCLTCLTYTTNQSSNPSSVNILLVVHGFLIKELVDYFLSKCSSTRDSNHDKIPNGSISIFEAILQGGILR